MTPFIQLTDKMTGRPIFVRRDAVHSTFVNAKGHNAVGLGIGGVVCVVESPEQIMKALGAAVESVSSDEATADAGDSINMESAALILAGLRLLQNKLNPCGIDAWVVQDILDEGGLGNTKSAAMVKMIDALCEQINVPTR